MPSRVCNVCAIMPCENTNRSVSSPARGYDPQGSLRRRACLQLPWAGTILQLAALEIIRNEVLGVAFVDGHALAIPITEAAFTDATIVDGLDSIQYVGESCAVACARFKSEADNEQPVG